MLEASQIDVFLTGRPVLHQAGATLRPGEVLGVIGANGSGKSTLLKVIAGLLPPARGEVRLHGAALSSLAPSYRARQIAYLPQHAECRWPLTAERVVALGRLPYGDEESEEGLTHARRALEAVDALALRERVVTELSGGERARVFLARALAGDPAFLLIDEPGAGLDPYHQLQMMELLSSRAAGGGGVLVVLHDLGLAARFCHRLLLLHEGKALAEGPPEEVLNDALLKRAHGISAYRARHEGEPVLAPWRRLSQ